MKLAGTFTTGCAGLILQWDQYNGEMKKTAPGQATFEVSLRNMGVLCSACYTRIKMTRQQLERAMEMGMTS